MRISVHLILLVVVGIVVVGLPASRWAGGFCSFVAFQRASGRDQIVQIYLSCVEKQTSGFVTSIKAACVWHLIYHLFEAIVSVVAGGFAVGIVESGFGGGQKNDTPPPRQRSDKLDLSALEAINIHLSDVLMSGHSLFATDVVESEIPSFKGVAIRLNVRGDNTTLHVHTNGSHAIATLDNGNYLSRRDVPHTHNQYYEFTGVNGLEMQAHGINHPSTSNYCSDLKAFAEHFALSNMQR